MSTGLNFGGLINYVQKKRKKESLEIRDANLPVEVRKVPSKVFGYNHRFRGGFARPAYDFKRIAQSKDSDSYIHQAVKKKVDRIFTAGFAFTSFSVDAQKYIQERIRAIEFAQSYPFAFTLRDAAHDLVLHHNAMLLKVRDSGRSLGTTYRKFGREFAPIVGLQHIPIDSIEILYDNYGKPKRVRQLIGETYREFPYTSIIHIQTNRHTGMTFGTPSLLPALDDVSIVRYMEELVETLIETNLFPVYHYKVGTKDRPERINPQTGQRESAALQRQIEYMPPASALITDYRVEVQAIGSESKALRIHEYIQYFKSRALAAIGISPVDLGEGGSTSRATANVLAQGTLLEVNAYIKTLSESLTFFLLDELLLESNGRFNPLDDQQRVSLHFEAVNKEEKIAMENHAIQLWLMNAITHEELRQDIGRKPLDDEELGRTHYSLVSEPTTLIKMAQPGQIAAEVLKELPYSNVSEEHINAAMKKGSEIAAQGTRGPKEDGSASSGSVSNKNQPANQQGSRNAPKIVDFESFTIEVNSDITDEKIDFYKQQVYDSYKLVQNYSSLETVAKGLSFLVRGTNE